jgi:hypothetical protein
VGRLIRKGVSKLEGELLVITVMRAASLERPTAGESASAGGSSALLSGAEPIGRGEPDVFRTAQRIVRVTRSRRGPTCQLKQDPVQSCPQKAGQRQRPIRECQRCELCQQGADLSADFNRGDGKRLECREDRRYADS